VFPKKKNGMGQLEKKSSFQSLHGIANELAANEKENVSTWQAQVSEERGPKNQLSAIDNPALELESRGNTGIREKKKKRESWGEDSVI